MSTQFDSEISKADPEYRPSQPLHVALGEAIDVAGAITAHRDPLVDAAGTVVVPSFFTGGPRVPGDLAERILGLVDLAQKRHTEYLLAARPGLSKVLFDRATYVNDEIESVLEFSFDDGVTDEKDAQLAAVKESTSSDAIDALAMNLVEVAALGTQYLSLIAEVPSFEVPLLTEATSLAAQLRALPAGNTSTPEAKVKLGLRNRTLAVLAAQVGLARVTARYVFRRHASVQREFTSTYERRRRAASWRAKAAAQVKPTG